MYTAKGLLVLVLYRAGLPTETSGPLTGSSEWALHRSALIALSHQHKHMQSVFISIDIILFLTGGGGSLTNASYLWAQHVLIRKLTI